MEALNDSMISQSSRKTELDLIRIFGCIGVITIHYSMAYDIAVRMLVNISVPLFMSLSGYLLFYRKEYNYSEIIKKIFLRYLVIFEVWKLVYQIYYFRGQSGIKAFIRFAIQNDEGWHLWYLKVYLTILLCYPIIRAITKDKKAYVCFSVAYLIFFSIRYSVATWFNLSSNVTRIFNLPFMHYTELVGGTTKGYYPMYALGIFIFGGAIINYYEHRKNKTDQNFFRYGYVILISAAVYIFSCSYCYLKHIEDFAVTSDPYMINMIFIMVGMIALCFLIAQKIHSEKIKGILAWLADKTLGVYILQNFVYIAVSAILDRMEIFSPMVRKPCIYFGVLCGGVVLTAIIHRIIPRKVGKYIV